MQDCRSVVSVISAHKLSYVDNSNSFKHTTQQNCSLKAWPELYLQKRFRERGPAVPTHTHTHVHAHTRTHSLALSQLHIFRQWWIPARLINSCRPHGRKDQRLLLRPSRSTRQTSDVRLQSLGFRVTRTTTFWFWSRQCRRGQRGTWCALLVALFCNELSF